MIAIVIQLVLTIVIPWGAEILQAIVFSLSVIQLLGAQISTENFAYAVSLYTIGHLGLARYRPGIAYWVRLIFCALWVIAGANFMLDSTSWAWPLNVAIGGFLGGCLGGRANFGTARALLRILEVEATALSNALAFLGPRLRPHLPVRRTPASPPRDPRGAAPQPPPHSRTEQTRPRRSTAHEPPREKPPRPYARPHTSSAPPRPPSPREDDPWTLLGVPPGASRETLRRAYLERMRQYHPDRVATLGPELQAMAEEKAKQINCAYETLRGRR